MHGCKKVKVYRTISQLPTLPEDTEMRTVYTMSNADDFYIGAVLFATVGSSLTLSDIVRSLAGVEDEEVLQERALDLVERYDVRPVGRPVWVEYSTSEAAKAVDGFLFSRHPQGDYRLSLECFDCRIYGLRPEEWKEFRRMVSSREQDPRVAVKRETGKLELDKAKTRELY